MQISSDRCLSIFFGCFWLAENLDDYPSDQLCENRRNRSTERWTPIFRCVEKQERAA